MVTMGIFSGSKIFKSLEHRNFRLYFFAQMLSLMGSWMQGTAQSWLLWRLTKSESMLGYLGFAQMGPVLLLGIFGGLIADRLHRRNLLLFTQTLALCQAALLTFLAYTNLITPMYLLILAALLGTINAFDMTARQTFLGDMVGMEDVGNAIALNSLLFNIARVVAPPIGGIIVGYYGEGLCFALNTASFLFVLMALLLMKVEPRSAAKSSSFASSLKEAFVYLKNDRTAYRVVLLLIVVSLTLLPYGYFMPYFADIVLGGKARMLGSLLASTGLGALIGALIVARKTTVSKLPVLLGISSFVLSIDLTLFSLSKTPLLSIPLLFIAGFCTMLVAASTNIFLQTNAPQHLRGRIVSFYVTAFIGFPPVGGFLIGHLAEKFGTRNVLMTCAMITAAVSFAYLVTSRKPEDFRRGDS
jgi:MFS family permease